ncbi:hypothetical protein HMPREF0578_1163 [Mobiluncus mulieris 28-1]|nr:hypothetical protein HMPREF0578_1163 [Mobiluncus mulieris 28-1]
MFKSSDNCSYKTWIIAVGKFGFWLFKSSDFGILEPTNALKSKEAPHENRHPRRVPAAHS